MHFILTTTLYYSSQVKYQEKANGEVTAQATNGNEADALETLRMCRAEMEQTVITSSKHSDKAMKHFQKLEEDTQRLHEEFEKTEEKLNQALGEQMDKIQETIDKQMQSLDKIEETLDRKLGALG